MVKVVRASQADIEAAVDALRDGELVAFPTETVYGLGANASNPAAVRKVFELKGRPPSHPVIVHIDERRYLRRWVREVGPAAEKLAEAFWPDRARMQAELISVEEAIEAARALDGTAIFTDAADAAFARFAGLGARRASSTDVLA